MELISVGIEGLNKLIGGGIPRRTILLLSGVPGVGKTVFCQQFIYEGLKNGEYGIYLTMDESPEDVKERMKIFGWDVTEYEKKGQLVFIDCYSWRLGELSGSKSRFALSSPTDINQLNRIVIEGQREVQKFSDKGRVVLDSLSTLVMYAGLEPVFKFTQVFAARAKQQNNTGLLVLEEGVHDEKLSNALQYTTDGVIEFRMYEDDSNIKRQLRILRMKFAKHFANWVDFEITDNGITIK